MRKKERVTRDEVCRYVRDNEGNKIGCLYAVRKEEKVVNIGWSSYNLKKENRPFSKAIARDIAKGRAKAGATRNQIPYEIIKRVPMFIETVKRVMGDPSKVSVITNFHGDNEAPLTWLGV